MPSATWLAFREADGPRRNNIPGTSGPPGFKNFSKGAQKCSRYCLTPFYFIGTFVFVKPTGRPAQLTGKRFGFLTVLKRAGNAGRRATWLCRCDCGNERLVRTDHLTCQHVASCARGHKINSLLLAVARSEYTIWQQMKARCKTHKRYNGRGIRVCERWNTFEGFMSDMGPRPSPLHSIDRYPDNDGDYTPDNCRWATRSEQMRNTSETVRVMFEGKLVPLADLIGRLGLNSRMIRRRLQKGWPVETALTRPSRIQNKPRKR